MTDKEHESPAKFGGFRFRAGEDDLEVVAAEDEPEASLDSLNKILKLPKKLLNKDPSLSDSDTSESSKLSEWWKDAEDVSHSDSLLNIKDQEDVGLKKRNISKRSDIKVTTGTVDANALDTEVEAGEEANESNATASTPPGSTSFSQDSSSIPVVSLPGDDDISPTVSINSSFGYPPTRSNFSHLKFATLYLFPIVAVSYITDNEFWRGIVYGSCLFAFLENFWRAAMNAISPSSDEVQRGPFVIPDYASMPLMKTQPIPIQKRGCFNVYNKRYDPETYSVTQTRAVCLELKDNTLKLIKVKTKLPKRARFCLPNFEVDTNHQSIYDLKRCTVMLLPHGLTKKRLFSKKYPITILIGEGAIIKDLKPGEEPYHSIGEIPVADTDELRNPYDDSGISVPTTPILYLFARCDRDKEDWYRRLLYASAPSEESSGLQSENLTDNNNKSKVFEEYLRCMSHFAELKLSKQLPKGLENRGKDLDFDSLDTQWFNAVINRILFDIFRSSYWTSQIQAKLQKKLSSLKLPYYVDEMQITEMDLGRSGPIIHRVSLPILDERGIWFDMAMTYQGTMRVTIQTKINLHKLQKGDENNIEEQPATEKGKSPLFDSDAEDSAESSSDDDDTVSECLSGVQEENTAGKSKKKQHGFLKIVENVAQSRAFRQVAQTRVVKKVIEGVSQTKLRLQVDVKGIVGAVAVNFPPPPSDRVWFGFRGMPKIWLSATPLLGERSIGHSVVKAWIEKKLIQEFQMKLVLPNMVDIVLPSELIAIPPYPVPSTSRHFSAPDINLDNLMEESTQYSISKIYLELIEKNQYFLIDSIVKLLKNSPLVDDLDIRDTVLLKCNENKAVSIVAKLSSDHASYSTPLSFGWGNHNFSHEFDNVVNDEYLVLFGKKNLKNDFSITKPQNLIEERTLNLSVSRIKECPIAVNIDEKVLLISILRLLKKISQFDDKQNKETVMVKCCRNEAISVVEKWNIALEKNVRRRLSFRKGIYDFSKEFDSLKDGEYLVLFRRRDLKAKEPQKKKRSKEDTKIKPNSEKVRGNSVGNVQPDKLKKLLIIPNMDDIVLPTNLPD